MRGDLADRRPWLARLDVLAYAAAAGLFVVGFNELCDFAQRGFAAVRDLHPWTPIAWTTGCTAAVAWLTRPLHASLAHTIVARMRHAQAGAGP